MQTIFDFIDKYTPQTVFCVVMVGFVSWFIYALKNAETYDGDGF